LEYGFTDGLSDEMLNQFSNALSNKNIRSGLLKSILLTSEKAKTLPNIVVNNLIENFKDFDDDSANLVIMSLVAICETINIGSVDELSPKLLDDKVIVDEGNKISFENRSEDNASCTSVSSVASKIFVSSLQNKNKIALRSIEYLISALDGKDKQTRILSAKALSMATEQNRNNVILSKLREYTEDKTADVAVYSIAAYSKGLAILS